LLTIDGGGFGLEAGIESTDLVLVFKTAGSVDRMLKGRLTLGTDVSVAAGPIGREAEIAGDGRLLPEIFSYSRSRGLFAGLALEGARLCVDGRAEESFYGLRGCRPEDVLAGRGAHVAAAENLKAELTRLTSPPPPAPPVLLVPR
jgi:lipid-binding SYLF domain-containing protein